jgi:glycosyltransferase involved in cell wall biosynthesis
VPEYLAAGDLGLLLRDPHPVNRVASPVKFAEYLAAGLPVLVSPGVGDAAAIVERERVGFVHRPRRALGAVMAQVAADRAGYGVRCREAARRLFDSDRYQDVYRDLVREQ